MAIINRKNFGEIGITVVMAIFALTFYMLATFKQTANPMDPGPALFPRLISILLVLMCVGQLTVSFRKKLLPRPKGKLRAGCPKS